MFHEYRIGLWESKENIECRVVNVTTVGDVFKDFSVVGKLFRGLRLLNHNPRNSISAIIEKDKIQDIHENVLLTFRLASKTPEQKREPSFLGLITRAHWSTFRRLDEVTPELRRYGKQSVSISGGTTLSCYRAFSEGNGRECQAILPHENDDSSEMEDEFADLRDWSDDR